MDALPIVLPGPLPTPRRQSPPFVAAIVPVIGGVVLWLITGSLFALCFAALGPLMLAASLIDGARTRRRDRRHQATAEEKAWADAETEREERHEIERAAMWLRLPDVAACLQQVPLRGSERPGAGTVVVVGRGAAASRLSCTGGLDARGRSFRERCGRLDDAPVAVALGGGVCVRGHGPVVGATARALAVQLCLRFGPGQLALVGADLADLGLDGLPHAARSGRGAFRVVVSRHGSARSDGDALIWLTDVDGEVPEGITNVIDVIEPRSASIRGPEGTVEAAVECLSRAQAERIGRTVAARTDDAVEVPPSVSLHELVPPTEDSGGLPVSIARSATDDLAVDIVADGPHAIVTGMTGAGKSELLVSWVAAIAARNGPERVVFVLADFKGGTAFEPLRALPQVAAVMTDLDEDGARRGVSSLTAELRRRETVLAAAGARDVAEVEMPRLIIVVDEFAALLQEHPDLGAVFTDIAARGRALGMHLILGTQRATGTIRDALASNCPLRISLRVVDAAESRFTIGTPEAAELAGGPESRGLAFVRRPSDPAPVAVRVARTLASDLDAIARRWRGQPAPRSPWLPALPRILRLADLPDLPERRDAIVLGLADDPDHQAQPVELLRVGEERGLAIVGAPGTGRTAALRTVAAQEADATWLPADLERAWDLVDAWCAGEPLPKLILADDLDALFADFPPEYAAAFAMRWEQLMRLAACTTVVVSAARTGGPVGRTIDALPRRALLRLPSRVDHLAAGGESDGYARDRPPGRARLGDREMQFAWVEPDPRPARRTRSTSSWRASQQLTALVTAGGAEVCAALRRSHDDHDVILGCADVASTTDRPRIIVADAETWQRHWPLWQRIRAEGEVLVRVERPSELRQLTGERELPPYAQAHAGRVWSVVGPRRPRRAVVPELIRS